MENAADGKFAFGEFELDAAQRRLSRGGSPVRVTAKALDLLLELIKNRGRVLSKDDLLDRVWPGQFVEENNLSVQISALRKIFDDQKDQPGFIATIPGRGYSFVAPLTTDMASDRSLKSRNRAVANVPTSTAGDPLIGRDDDLRAVVDLLNSDGCRLVTLTGAGGCGKTRLAHAAADNLAMSFRDGAYFATLAEFRDPALLTLKIAEVLQIDAQQDVSMMDVLVSNFDRREILLVLDNFEHILPAAPIVAELLARSPGVKVLVTSRTPLRIANEIEVAVPPLELPPAECVNEAETLINYAAIQLFTTRAQKVKSGFSCTDLNAAAVAAICRKLDGLPLAIELAAARIRLLSPQAILERLDRALDLLSHARGAAHRQSSIRDTIAWSYDLLDDNEKALFRRLSVFSGGITVSAAEAILPDTSGKGELSVLNLLSSLAESNLLTVTDRPDESVRMYMLEVVREFAFEALELGGELAETSRLHARYFMGLAQDGAPHSSGLASLDWLQKLSEEHDNLRAALRWATENEIETAAKIASSLRYFWSNRSYLAEGYEWLTRIMERSGDLSEDLRFSLENGIGQFARSMGDQETAREIYLASLGEARLSGNAEQMIISCHGLAAIATRQENYLEAQMYNEEELAIARALKKDSGIAIALAALGDVALASGRNADARPLIEESLEISLRLKHKYLICTDLVNLGIVDHAERHLDRALDRFKEALQISSDLGNKPLASCALDGIAAVAAESGELMIAANIAGAAEQLRRSAGYTIEPTERIFCESYISKLKTRLGPAEFDGNFNSGLSQMLGAADAPTAWLSVATNGTYENDLRENADVETEIVIETRKVSRIIIEN